jgi:hypothetical protein
MTLHQALAKAQAEFEPVAFDSEAQLGGNRRYRYASLRAVLEAVRPALNQQGIFVSQACTEVMLDDGKNLAVRCVTRLYLGEQVLEEVSEKRMDDGTIHKHGSVQTYLKRYQLCNMLAVVGEEDEDGHIAQPTAGGSKAAPPKRARQGTAKPEPDAGGEAPSSAPPAGERVVEVILKRVNSGVTTKGTRWAIGVFTTRDGEELRCGTFSATWVDVLIIEQRNQDRIWQLTLSPPKKEGDAYAIEGMHWVTESGELIDPDVSGIPF